VKGLRLPVQLCWLCSVEARQPLGGSVRYLEHVLCWWRVGAERDHTAAGG
jgi:hypothetical protein